MGGSEGAAVEIVGGEGEGEREMRGWREKWKIWLACDLRHEQGNVRGAMGRAGKGDRRLR
jgi:hypothetical protein